MRFMIIVKATEDTEAGVMPTDKLAHDMAAYMEELSKAGVLLDGMGLQPSKSGWRVQYSNGKRTGVIDGPFTEAKELIAGVTLIQVKSREEALEWSKRMPAPDGGIGACEIEVRRIYELEEIIPDAAAADRFRKIGIGTDR
jgi:hypothetical protein